MEIKKNENIANSKEDARTELSAREKNRKYINTLTGLGILTALVIVLQLLSSVIKFGMVSVTLTLTPIIVGGALYGVLGGAWLGTVFGVVVILQPDTGIFLTTNPLATIALCIIKGAAAGAFAALVYRLLEKRNMYVAIIAAGVVAPVVNTGIFILGSVLFFLDIFGSFSTLLVTVVTINFFVEIVVNLALSAVTVTVIKYIKKVMNSK